MLRRLVPKPVRVAIRRAQGPLLDSALDLSDKLFHRREEFTPPRKMWKMVGGDDYEQVGKEFFEYLVGIGGLRPDDRVLDIGCGTGKIAARLTKFLEPPGSYEGLDIVPAGIDWCQRKITPRNSIFRFQLIDVYNRLYNPKGTLEPSQYRLPYPDESFDFAILASVFTHMLPSDVENYFSQLARVMKKGSKCLITFFLKNPESDRLIEDGLSTLPLHHLMDGYSTIDPNCPERAVGYDECSVRQMYKEHGFKIMEPIHYGHWVKRAHFLSYQDIIVALRTPQKVVAGLEAASN